jgi:hypothetical protein
MQRLPFISCHTRGSEAWREAQPAATTTTSPFSGHERRRAFHDNCQRAIRALTDGSKLPSSMIAHPMPSNVTQQVRETKDFDFAKLSDKILLVDKSNQTIADVLPLSSITGGPGIPPARLPQTSSAAEAVFRSSLIPKPRDGRGVCLPYRSGVQIT